MLRFTASRLLFTRASPALSSSLLPLSRFPSAVARPALRLSPAAPQLSLQALNRLSLQRVFTRSFSNANNQNAGDAKNSSSSSSSSPLPETPKEPFSVMNFISSALDRIPRLRSILIFGGVFIGVLSVIRVGVSTVEFFSTINFLNVGEAAFLAGMLAGVGLVAVVVGGLRVWQIRPESVYSQAYSKVMSDIRIKHILGSNTKTASFKAYSFIPGHFRLSASDRERARKSIEMHRFANLQSDLRHSHQENPTGGDINTPVESHSALKKLFNESFLLWYKPKCLQLFFQLNSPDNTAHAMISAEVEKTFRGEMIWNILSVDFMETGDRIVLEGDPEYKIYQGIIKLR